MTRRIRFRVRRSMGKTFAASCTLGRNCLQSAIGRDPIATLPPPEGNPEHHEMRSPRFITQCYGSGAARARVLLRKSAGTPTTKGVLTVLTSVIEDSSVPTVGGVPQMVTIWKKSSQLVGFNREISATPTSTLLGLPLYFQSDLSRVRFLDWQFRPSAYLHSAKLRHARKN